jgi:hypothetical protein
VIRPTYQQRKRASAWLTLFRWQGWRAGNQAFTDEELDNIDIQEVKELLEDENRHSISLSTKPELSTLMTFYLTFPHDSLLHLVVIYEYKPRLWFTEIATENAKSRLKTRFDKLIISGREYVPRWKPLTL